MRDYVVSAHGRDIRLKGHDGDHICSSLWGQHAFYERQLLDDVLTRHPIHGTIIEVGAHCGNHAVYYAEFMQYEKIVCFEPYIDSFKLLAANMARYEGFTLHNKAVSDTRGTASMAPFPGIMDYGSMRLTAGNDVDVVCLDDYAWSNVTLIKIDAEGFDAKVIAGGMKMIRKHKPTIIIELDRINIYKDVYDLLGDLYVPVATWNAGGQTYELMYKGGSALGAWDMDKIDLAIREAGEAN